MKKIIFYLSILFFIICEYSTLSSQTESKKEQEQKAYSALQEKDYVLAYELLDKLNAKYPKELNYKFKLGLACLSYPEKKDRAIDIFTEIKKEAKDPEIDFYIGKAYHENYKFDEAITSLKYFIEKNSSAKKKEDSKELLEEAELILIHCENGMRSKANKIKGEIRNLGSPVNTEDDEYVPCITTDESVLIYTYRGKNSMGGKLNSSLKKDDSEGAFHEDVYLSAKNYDGTWSEPIGIVSVNTNGEDAAISVSPDGQTLFTFFSTKTNEGDIYSSTLMESGFSKPEPLNKNINSESWEGSCSISGDGRYLYFASERPGGQGGRDIWLSEKIDDEWGPAVNLGPTINTKYDDDAPFIHPDGITLFFSSKGHGSIGGYDIMFSVKKENEWIEPQTMGIPLNTTEDDRYYVINSDGSMGYFSSNRPRAGGIGKQDIYMVTPGVLGEKPVIALLKGMVYGNDKPIEAKIEVLKLSKNEFIGPYTSNRKTGRYLTALSPGYLYRIKVIADGFDSVEEDLDVERLNSFIEVNKDFYLYSPDKAYLADSMRKVLAVKAANSKADPNIVWFNDKTNGQPNSPSINAPLPTDLTVNGDNGSKTNTTGNKINNTSGNSNTDNESNDLKNNSTSSKNKTQGGKNKNTSGNNSGNNNENNEGNNSFGSKNKSQGSEPCGGGSLPNFASLKGKSLNEIQYYNQLLNMMGNYCDDGLVYKVQIGAYRKPENYKYKNLIEYGKPEILDYPDGITRFTQLQFKNLKSAEVHRQRAISKGQKDAWIVAFINGKRYTLEELIMLDWLGKGIN